MLRSILFLALSFFSAAAMARTLTPVLECVYPFEQTGHTLHGNWYGQGHLKLIRTEVLVENTALPEVNGQIKIYGIDPSHRVVQVKVLDRVQVIRNGAMLSVTYSPYSPTTHARAFTMLIDTLGRGAVRTQGVATTLSIPCRSR